MHIIIILKLTRFFFFLIFRSCFKPQELATLQWCFNPVNNNVCVQCACLDAFSPSRGQQLYSYAVVEVQRLQPFTLLFFIFTLRSSPTKNRRPNQFGQVLVHISVVRIPNVVCSARRQQRSYMLKSCKVSRLDIIISYPIYLYL